MEKTSSQSTKVFMWINFVILILSSMGSIFLLVFFAYSWKDTYILFGK